MYSCHLDAAWRVRQHGDVYFDRRLWALTAGVRGRIAGTVLVGAFALILVVWRIRVAAGLLLYPYLGWLMFAGLLNFQILQLNPNASTLEPGARTINIDVNRM